MKKSLTIKMFLLTFLSFMILISSIIIFNTLFFDKVYEQSKINKIINNINSFADKYMKNDWNQLEFYRQQEIFYANNNADLAVYDNKNINYLVPNQIYENDDSIYNSSSQAYTNFLITVEDNNQNYYDIYVDEQTYKSLLSEGKLYKDTKIHLKGYITEDYMINPIQINEVNLNHDQSMVSDQLFDKDVYVRKIDYIDESILNGGSEEGFKDLVTNGGVIYGVDYEQEYATMYQKKGVNYSIQKVPYSVATQAVFTKTINTDKENKISIQVVASLQPVSDAVSVIKEYYIYFYILAALISLIIAFIYSRLVTRPIVKLSRSANRMAHMDFTNNYTVNSKDELGLLSTSLNTLSGNLNNTLSELKEANYQLKLDYEKEIKQEKSRKEFVANVSHELKTPLGIIKGFAEGIKDGIKKEKRDYYIDVILDEIEKMNELILEMLELSKLEAGALKLKLEQFDLNDLVNKTTSVFELPVSDKGLNINVSGFYSTVYADKSKIEQVLVNLVGNAIKHSSNNSEIDVYGEIKGDFNYVYVKNKCVPLSEQELENIWHRFYKTDKSHNRDNGGTGLGLAIVKAIMEAHGYDYGVKSCSDGIVFYFALSMLKS